MSLSFDERLVLSDIAAHLAAQDPELAALLTGGATGSPGRRAAPARTVLPAAPPLRPPAGRRGWLLALLRRLSRRGG